MADYTEMSGFYDVIMTAGYYDYERIATALSPYVDAASQHGRTPRVLELGCGTGLILESVATQYPAVSITGVDLTEAMLEQARERLADQQNVHLVRADIRHALLEPGFDVVFSYGGIWYFVPDGQSYTLVSHLRDDTDNRLALSRVASWVPVGGRLLLGVQGPHHDYERPVTDELVYEQSVLPINDGFRKRYGLRSGTELLMEQTIEYRTYPAAAAIQLLQDAGFELVADPTPDPLFLQLVRR